MGSDRICANLKVTNLLAKQHLEHLKDITTLSLKWTKVLCSHSSWYHTGIK